jgi:hypothetical protein
MLPVFPVPNPSACECWIGGRLCGTVPRGTAVQQDRAAGAVTDQRTFSEYRGVWGLSVRERLAQF